MAYGSEQEFADLNKINHELENSPDDFDVWEKLVAAAEGLEGGLHRNSSPQAIMAARDVYDRFLAKFPLFFGYWKKYADMEFSLAGTEAAEFVYERAVACVGSSVDLWTHYCSFKVETTHDPDIIRELFERGAESVGLDFLAHPFWDKYIDFEERVEQRQNIFSILARVIKIPLHQYARYFDRYRYMASTIPINAIADTATMAYIMDDEVRSMQAQGASDNDIEPHLRVKLDQHVLQVFNRTQIDVNARWVFEAEIKRPYFHVTELDEGQLRNWHKYLDFEEEGGDFDRICFLYERCLVAAAHYEEFWFRYARFMWAQEDKIEETRNIYVRASCFFVPIATPHIRYQWALFEEAQDRPDAAADIYESISIMMPDHLESIHRYATITLKAFDLDTAAAIYRTRINQDKIGTDLKGCLITGLAWLVYRATNDAAAAAGVFEQHKSVALNSQTFWSGWLDFLARLPVGPDDVAQYRATFRGVFEQIRPNNYLIPGHVKHLTIQYMDWLAMRDSKAIGAKEYLDLEAATLGSSAVSSAARTRIQSAKQEDDATDRNGV